MLNVTNSESKRALSAPHANFLNTKNIYRGAKSSVVGMRLPITLKTGGAEEYELKQIPLKHWATFAGTPLREMAGFGCYILYALLSYADIFIQL